MKIIRLFFLIVITFTGKSTQAQYAIPQLQAGVYINQTIFQHGFSLTPSCDSSGFNSASYSISSDLSPVVSGVEIKLIVTQIPTPPDSVYTLQSGALHIGDTFSFPITLILSSVGAVFFSLNIVGTPSVPLESYPCSFDFYTNFTLCEDGWLMIPWPTYCTVDNFNEMSEFNLIPSFHLSPNPASNYIEIYSSSNLKRENTLRLFDCLGNEIQRDLLPVNFSSGKIKIERTPDGLYFWSITDQSGFAKTGKLVIQN